MSPHRTVLLALLCGALSAPARAQDPLPPDPVRAGTMNIGPVALTPKLELRDVGLDSNVFNDAEGAREDFTATIRPSLDAAMRVGIARVVYRSWMDLVYFHKYTDERSVNRFGEVRAELRFTRFVPYVSIGGLDTRERPNTEIDLRADRTTQTRTAGAALAVLPSTAIVAGFQRHTVTFDPQQPFRGVDLGEQLNSQRDSLEGGLRFALTPLTTLLLTGAVEDATFPLSPDRDSESWRASLRFEFDPTALISGTASVGYRDFSPANPVMEGYRGVVAQVTARYAPGSQTLISVQYMHDLEYSVEEEQPYYVINGVGVTLTQRIAGPFDVQVTGRRDRLNYRRLLDATAEAGADTTSTAAGGIGYRIGQSSRLGVTLEFTKREAQRADRSYDRRRILASMAHGF